MTRARTKAACDESAMRVDRLVVDVTDAMKHPNIRAAINHLASLSDEQRAKLRKEWNDENT